MAYQPKSYRKFVATAATATLVATAVTPAFAAEFTDVPERYEAAVSYLVDNNITLGLTTDTFGTQQTITRVDAAIMIAKALKLDTTDVADSGFTDVPARAKAYVDALKAAGLVGGKTTTTFGSSQEITRGEMALILAKAYSLTGDTANVNFSDVSARYLDAVAALVDNKITSGTSETTFGTTAAIKRGDFAIFLHRLSGDVVVTPEVSALVSVNSTTLEVTFDGALTAEQAAELEFEFSPALEVKSVKLKDEVKAAAEGDVQTTVVVETAEQVEGQTYALVAVNGTAIENAPEVTAPVVAAEVKEVTAVNTKTLEVKFNKAVSETAKASFTVKRGTVTANVSKVTWNADNTAAQLELASKFVAGDYTVNVTGVAENALTGSVKVENEKVAAVEIASENAVLAAGASPTTATVGYKVVNQYGEDITAKTSLTAAASNGQTVNLDATKGTATITGLSSPKAGDKVSLTLVHSETATTSTKVLTISEASKVSEVAINGLYNADEKELSVDNKAGNFYLKVEAQDQYGNALKAADLNNNVVVSSSNSAVVNANNTSFSEITIDGKKVTVLKLDTANATAGKATISVISLASGKVTQTEVEVKEAVKVDAFTVSQPELAVAGEKVNLPFEAFDQQGNKVDTKTLLDAVSVKANGAGLNNQTVSFVKDAKTSAVNLSLDLTNATATGGKVTITAITPTNKFVNLVVDVKETAKPVYISSTKDVVTNVQQNQNLEISLDNIVVKDQYDRDLDLTNKLGSTAGKYKVVATIPSGSTVLDFVQANNVDQDTIDASGDKIVVTGSSKGNETLTLKLVEVKTVNNAPSDDAIAGSEIDSQVRVATESEYVSYEVKSVDALYDDKAVDGPAVNNVDTEKYTREVVVYGVLASGQKVVLPAAAYTVTTNTKGVEVTTVSNKPHLNVEAAVLNTSDVKYATDATTATGAATVTINANGQQLTTNFTITQAKPQVASVKFSSTLVDAGVAQVADTNAAIAAADLFALLGTGNTAAEIKDQYGELVVVSNTTGVITYADTSTAATTILISDYSSVGTADHTISGNGTASAGITAGAQDDESFKATLNLDGYQVPVKVTVQ